MPLPPVHPLLYFSRRRALGFVLAAIVLGVVPAALGCGTKSEPGLPEAGAPAVVPAPVTLAATFVVPAPNATWKKLQATVGGGAGLLPMTLGGLAVSFLAVDGALVGEIDGTSPAYGALLGSFAAPDWVVALKVNDAKRARGLLPEAGSRRSPSPYPFAITDNGYLVIGSTEAALDSASAFVTRTLPAEKASAHAFEAAIDGAAIDRAALSFKEAAASLLLDLDQKDDAMRKQHDGRAPDFADPKALLGAAKRFLDARGAELGDLASARGFVDIEDETVVAEAVLSPKPGNGPAATRVASLAKVDPGELRSLPREVDFAFAVAESDKEREADAAFVGDLVSKAMGERLGKDDQARLGRAFSGLSARAPTLAGSFALSPTPQAFLRTKADDGASYSRALDDVFELFRLPAFKEPLRIAEVKIAKEPWQGASASTLSARRESNADPKGKGAKADKGARPLASWAVKGKNVFLAVAEDPLATLGTGASEARTLGDDEVIGKYIDRAAEGEASFVAVSAPLRLLPAQIGSPSIPVAASVSRVNDGRALRIRAFVAMGILREKARIIPR